jgi:photosystem II stability/assembly factor-like uncharacterized protein
MNSNTTLPLKNVHFINANTGVVVGNGGIILKTTNGGQNWTQSILTDGGINPNLFSVYYFDENTGIIGGHKIYKTLNGGINWTIVNILNSGDTARSFCLVSNLIGFCAQNSSTYILKTINGGNSWSEVGISDNYTDLTFVNTNTGYAVAGGSFSYVYKTTDGGTNWSHGSSISGDLYSIAFIDVNTGFIIGKNGYYYKTTNGGTNWVSSNILGSSDNFYKILKTANNNLFVFGLSGSIIKSTNQGVNWIAQNSNTFSTLRWGYFIDDNIGYSVGDLGTIIKTTNGGSVFISQIGSNIPDKYSLKQNYPNPFNPTTNIKFDITKSENVKLIVFDALGREVFTLVNEQLSPGTYETSWDASKYSSGVYFYRITAGEYSETKRMTLIK